MEINKIKNDIRSYIIDTILVGYDDGFEDDTSFEDDGVFDSVGIFELIQYIENTFNIKVLDDEIIPENFDSLNKVSLFVSRKFNGN